MATFIEKQIGARIEKLTFGVRKPKDSSLAPIKIVVMTLLVQPFTADLAEELGLKRHLFALNTGEPLENVISTQLKIAPSLQKVGIAMAPDTRDSVTIRDVTVHNSVAIRRDKEGPIFAATFRLSFELPDADTIQWLAREYTEMAYFVFEPDGQRTLDEAAAAEEDDQATENDGTDDAEEPEEE